MVPYHKDEVDNQRGTIAREDRKGNSEADKLAIRGGELHKVPKDQEEAVGSQDALVEGLLQRTLNVMGNVHDKAPARKKEERHKQEETQRKFQGLRQDRTESTFSSTGKEEDRNAQNAIHFPGIT